MAELIFRRDKENRLIECYRKAECKTFWTARIYQTEEYIGYVNIKDKTYYSWDGRRHDYTVDELQQIINNIEKG